MMLRRMLCVLCILALLPLFPALAEESNADILTLEELRQWAEDYKTRAMQAQPLNDPTAAESATEDGYMFVYEFATLYMDRPEMMEDSMIQALVITSDEEADLRGVRVDDPAETVLAAYYTENDDLVGNREQALLYAVDMMPMGAYVGDVHRDGQRIQVLDYSVYEQPPTGGNGYTGAGILYTVEGGNVSTIRAYGLTTLISAEVVAEVMENARKLGAEMTYSQVQTSRVGTELDIFNSEDMIFSGIDFPSLTPEDAMEAFGAANEDMWLEDVDGYMRVMQFENCDLIFLYDSARQNGRIKSLTIDTDSMEGPRSVRVGDLVASVRSRFRNGEGEDSGVSEILYGSEDSGVFGMADYGMDASALLRYGALTEDGTPVLMYLSFEELSLREIILMINE